MPATVPHSPYSKSSNSNGVHLWKPLLFHLPPTLAIVQGDLLAASFASAALLASFFGSSASAFS
jgi:hypothetical protein